MNRMFLFGAGWCSVCPAAKVKAKQIHEQSPCVYKELDVDTEEGMKWASEYNIRSLPMLIVLDSKGDVVYRASGASINVEEVVKINEGSV
jgi:thiol-disulfide isomerase/thioredoxin